MKYVIALLIVALLIRYALKKKKPRPVARPEGQVLRQDPVCGAYVPEDREFSLRTSKGTVYFCSTECMKRYKERTPSG